MYSPLGQANSEMCVEIPAEDQDGGYGVLPLQSELDPVVAPHVSRHEGWLLWWHEIVEAVLFEHV